jgi:hypothetical protein
VPKYDVERNIPGAGSLKPEELHAISQKSCGVLGSMGPQTQWQQIFVTADKIYCVYIAIPSSIRPQRKPAPVD